MERIIKICVLLIALGYQLSAFSSYADDDIDTDPLFTSDDIYYQPIKPEDLEAQKVSALKDQNGKIMYVIGMMYRDGKGVDADVDQAREWFKNASEAGNSDAMVELARIYSLDKEFTGIDKDEKGASKWIKEAEKRNNAKALYTMGLMYEEGFPFERSYETSFEYYKKAAYRGILNAYVKLYIAYQYGKGVEPDLEKAIYWLRKIQMEANEGKIKDYAKHMLSEIYFELALKEQDDTLKFKLFNLAWANDNRYAIDAIGDMLQAGHGVKQSYSSALVAYETSIKKYESVYAMERMGFIYLKGPAEINRDYDKAFALFKRGSDLGGVTSSYMMGYMYFYGLGVEKNNGEASKWFARSQQFASRKRKDANVARSSMTKSNNALQGVLSEASVKEKEKQRQKTVEDKINASKKGGGAIGPDVPDVPQY